MAVSTRLTLRLILLVQVGLALGLVSRDFMRIAPELTLPWDMAPQFETPIAPGDQTRRYAPSPFRFGPLRPSGPGLQIGDMPSRLFFERLEGGEISLSGAIEVGDAVRFQEWMAEEGVGETPMRVLLHSTGGSVSDALEIGRALREAGHHTGVRAKNVCLSACPYILMGGTERAVSDTAKVGVHQHYFGETSYLPAFLAVEDIQRSQAGVLVYVTEMGVDPQVMAAAMATPPQDIYVLVPDELSDWNVATEVTEGAAPFTEIDLSPPPE